MAFSYTWARWICKTYIYETLAAQGNHIERGDVTDEFEAAMTEHFNPTRAAGNARQWGNENRELPGDNMEPHTQDNSFGVQISFLIGLCIIMDI